MKIGRFGLGELSSIVGGGAAIAAVFQPWYSFRLSDLASDTIIRQSGLDALSATVFQQGLNAGFAAHQPTAWELFDRTDWVLLVIGAVAALTAVLAVVGLVDRPQPQMLLLGGSAILAVGYRLAIPPVDDSAIEVSLATWGWVALAGAILIALSATIPPPSSAPKRAAPTPAVDASPPPAALASHAPAYGGVGSRAPGWYDDPEGSGMQRYWDGSSWTWDTRKPVPVTSPPATPPTPA